MRGYIPWHIMAPMLMECASLVGTGNFYQPWSGANPNWDFEVQLVKLNSIGKFEDKAPTSSRWWFHPDLGKWSNLTNMFQLGWNHQRIMVCQEVLMQMQSNASQMPIALQPWIWSSGWRKVMLTHINGYIELWYYIYICPYIISFLHRAFANLHALHIYLLNLEAHSHPRQAVQVAPGAPVPAAQTPGTRAWRHGCNGRCRPSRRSSPSCASAVNSQDKHLILRC